jgi:hypothetical protein
MKFHFFYIIKMEWYEYPNNNRPVMLDLDEKGYNVNSIHPNLLNTRVADAYMTYNPVIRPAQNWIEKTTYIPIGSNPALSNSHRYNGDQRRTASVEKDGSPLENNSCRAKRTFIYEYCHRDIKNPRHICKSADNDKQLRLKHNKWMSCRNARAEFQNSNCRIDAESPEWVDPDNYGHLERIKISAKEAERCVNEYNHPFRVDNRAFEAGAPPEEEVVPPPIPAKKEAAHPPAAVSGVQSRLRARIAAAVPTPPPPPPVATSGVQSRLRARIAAAEQNKPLRFSSRRKKSKTKSRIKKSRTKSKTKKSRTKSKTKKSRTKSRTKKSKKSRR